MSASIATNQPPLQYTVEAYLKRDKKDILIHIDTGECHHEFLAVYNENLNQLVSCGHLVKHHHLSDGKCFAAHCHWDVHALQVPPRRLPHRKVLTIVINVIILHHRVEGLRRG